MLNSFTKRSPQQSGNLNETRANTSILPPEITSTPLISPSRNRMTAPLLTPTRKMLGTKKYSLSSSGFMSPSKVVKNPPGPLLASPSYTVNIKTYVDAKSVGYFGRLAQYNEEDTQRPRLTHQEKYDRPGYFPIVHLFKRQVPVISPKPKKATIRIGTPEIKSPYSQEHSRLLLEGIVRNNTTPKDQDRSSDSTRSVLDALKEISRKRIHSNEEYEALDETNKKLKRDCVINDGESTKRNRMDSPTSESGSPPTRQPSKRMCTVDAITASKTSSEGCLPNSNRKKIVRAAETTPTREVKRFSNAETQTAEILHSKQQKRLVDEYIADAQKENQDRNIPVKITSVVEEPVPTPQPTLKIFDDKPLELIRKNRLGALLSALTGREIPQIPMEDRRRALEESWDQRNSKKSESITSTQDKQEKSTKKHVTFNIPESSSTETSKDSEKNAEIIEKIPEQVGPSIQNDTPKTSTGANSTDSKDKIDNSPVKTTPEKTTSTTPEKTTSTTPEKTTTSPLGGFKFDTVKSTPPTIPAPIGGFKFDLTKPTTSDKNVTDVSTVSNSNITLPTLAESKAESAKVISTPSVASPITSVGSFLSSFAKPSSKPDNTPKSTFELKSPGSKSATNSLGLPSTLPQTTTPFAFGSSTSSAPFTFGTTQTITSTASSQEKLTPVFSFGKTEPPKISVAAAPSPSSKGSLITTSAATTLTMSSFGNPRSSASIVPSSSSTQSALTSTTNSALPSSNPLLSSSAPSFAITTSSTSANFGKLTSPNFASSSNAPNNLFSTPTPFGATSTTTASNFGTSTTSSAVPATTSTGFNFSAGNSLPAFGGSSATPAFGQVSSTPSSFSVASLITTSPANNSFGGSTATTAGFAAPFGNSTSTTQMFGATTTASFGSTSSSTNSFGSNTAKPFVFGSNNATPNNSSTSANGASMFALKNSQSQMTLGTNTTASTASNLPFATPPAFGTSNTMFSTTNNSFGKSTTVPSFGTTTPSFAAATIAPTFGSTTPSFAAATTAPTFGTTTPSFAAATTASTFGQSNFTNNSTIPVFGKTNTPAFGSSTTTSMFGTTNTPTFGTANTTASGFGTSSTLNFGAQSTSAPTFGTNSPSLFGTTNQTFGTTTSSGFGSTNTPSFSASNNFASSFGSTSAAPFGTAATTASSTFNISSPFGATPGTNAMNGFGSTNSPFPTTTASSFGASGSTFGSTNATTFGTTGSTTNGFGSTNGPFGSTTRANSFGTNNMAPSNSFNSGFGSAGSKPESSNIFSSQGTNMFGSTPGFGSSQSNGPAPASTNGVFTFGSPNVQSSSTNGVFAFGVTEPPKTFNFTTPGQSGNSGGFPSAPSFGQPNPSMPSMFSIGSGSSTNQNRSGRAFARGKRRT